MKLVNGKLVMEKRNCWSCHEGKVPGRKPCETCKGTGKGKRGKVGGCRQCYGSKTEQDWNNMVVCEQCGGNPINALDEDLTDTLPSDIWHGLTFKVIRTQAGQSFNESYIGAGYVLCCTDYGKTWAMDDAAVIESVKRQDSNQACKVAKDDGTVCDHVVITVKPMGYNIRAVFA